MIGVRIGRVTPPSTNAPSRSFISSGEPKMNISSIRLPRCRRGRRLAVARLPGGDHRVDLIAVAEPAVEGGVDGDGDVGGEHEAGQRLDRLALAGQAEEAAEQLEALGRALELAATLGSPPSGRKLVKAPSPRSTASSSILPRSAASTIGTRSAGGDLELEAGRGALAVERRAQELERLADRLSGFSKGIPFQPSTIRSEEEPIPSTKRPPEASASAAASWASSAGPRWKTPTMPVPSRARSVQAALRVSGVKPSGPVGLAAPEVGVAGRLGALDQLLVIGQRGAGQRQRQSPSLSHAATL